MTEFDDMLPLIDRIIKPLDDRLGRIEDMLVHVVSIGERVAIVEQAKVRTDVRLEALEASDAAQAKQLAKTEGRNSIINWILVTVGAPLVVTLAGAAIIKLLGVG